MQLREKHMLLSHVTALSVFKNTAIKSCKNYIKYYENNFVFSHLIMFTTTRE